LREDEEEKRKDEASFVDERETRKKERSSRVKSLKKPWGSVVEPSKRSL